LILLRFVTDMGSLESVYLHICKAILQFCTN